MLSICDTLTGKQKETFSKRITYYSTFGTFSTALPYFPHLAAVCLNLYLSSKEKTLITIHRWICLAFCSVITHFDFGINPNR